MLTAPMNLFCFVLLDFVSFALFLLCFVSPQAFLMKKNPSVQQVKKEQVSH